MNELKIEKGVPVPLRHQHHIHYRVFDRMEIGDSVFFPEISRQLLWQALQKRKPKTFATRQQRLDGVVGIRVWRTG